MRRKPNEYISFRHSATSSIPPFVSIIVKIGNLLTFTYIWRLAEVAEVTDISCNCTSMACFEFMCVLWNL